MRQSKRHEKRNPVLTQPKSIERKFTREILTESIELYQFLFIQVNRSCLTESPAV